MTVVADVPSSTAAHTGASAAVARQEERSAKRTGGRWISPVAVLLLWQVCSSTGVLTEDVLASPSQIFATAIDLTRAGTLPDALWVSLQRAFFGLLLGSTVAIVAAVIAGTSRVGDLALDPVLQAIRTIPLFGLVPLFILWFGIGETPKVLLVALGVVVPLYLNTVAALRSVDPELLEVARSFRLTRTERWRHVVIPSVLPAVLVGFRQSLGIAWLALIVAEQIAASNGLGYMINNARDFLQTNVIVVGLLAYAVLGLITDAIVRVLERRALRYREQGSSA